MTTTYFPVDGVPGPSMERVIQGLFRIPILPPIREVKVQYEEDGEMATVEVRGESMTHRARTSAKRLVDLADGVADVTSGQEPVQPALIAEFAKWVEQRTQQGILKYGEPLQTFNNRDAQLDMLEELLDFCQYQQQRLMELQKENNALRENAEG